jgi:hypothetical protein
MAIWKRGFPKRISLGYSTGAGHLAGHQSIQMANGLTIVDRTRQPSHIKNITFK